MPDGQRFLSGSRARSGCALNGTLENTFELHTDAWPWRCPDNQHALSGATPSSSSTSTGVLRTFKHHADVLWRLPDALLRQRLGTRPPASSRSALPQRSRVMLLKRPSPIIRRSERVGLERLAHLLAALGRDPRSLHAFCS